MGHYTAVIHGEGPHDSDSENDADVRVREFAQSLAQSGHTVHHVSLATADGVRHTRVQAPPTAEDSGSPEGWQAYE